MFTAMSTRAYLSALCMALIFMEDKSHRSLAALTQASGIRHHCPPGDDCTRRSRPLFKSNQNALRGVVHSMDSGSPGSKFRSGSHRNLKPASNRSQKFWSRLYHLSMHRHREGKKCPEGYNSTTDGWCIREHESNNNEFLKKIIEAVKQKLGRRLERLRGPSFGPKKHPRRKDGINKPNFIPTPPPKEDIRPTPVAPPIKPPSGHKRPKPTANPYWNRRDAGSVSQGSVREDRLNYLYW